MASGRKKAFCEQQALEAAMQVFWKKGYVGSSLSDLTDSMGINKPSMYAAFGNKEALFIEATRHYVETRAQRHGAFLEEIGVALGQRVRNYMMSVLSGQCETDAPKGCYISLCLAEAAGDEIPDKARELIDETANFALDQLTQLFSEDEEAISLGLDKVAKDKALFLVSIMHGTASLSRAGKPLDELTAVIDGALVGAGLDLSSSGKSAA